MKGNDPDVLGSPRDVIFRKYALSELSQESRKLMAVVAGGLNNATSARSILTEYSNAIFDSADTKKAHYNEMLEYYDKHIKHLVPEAQMVRDDQGNTNLKVTGLEELTNGR